MRLVYNKKGVLGTPLSSLVCRTVGPFFVQVPNARLRNRLASKSASFALRICRLI